MTAPTPPRYGDRMILVHHSIAPLSAADIRNLARHMDDLGVPDAALIEVRTPLRGDRRKVDLGIWVDESPSTTTEVKE